jgi:UDP-glucose:(heptosyl)LPS alpha-1,3-glucosyltransferase
MRVAIVRQRYNPYGGAERFIERALPALERAGAELTLIARRAEGWGARRLVVVDPRSFGSTWRDASFARAARDAWEAGNFDLVQSHERIPGCDIYRAGDGVHAEWIAIRRAAATTPAERAALALNPYHCYVLDAERRLFADAGLRAVVCNSRMVRGEIERNFGVGPHKLHVIYNGVDLDAYHPRHRAAWRDAARAELGIPAGDFLFVFVGSGFWRKGLDAAIAALAGCATSCRLAVAGKDRDAARYARQATAAGVAHRVHFLGGRDDVRHLYAAADCFILPTRYDPFPNTAFEALAMGLPVLVGRRSGAAEVVRDGENGWVCDPADPQALAAYMREVADGRAEAMGGAARATAENFGIDAMARQLSDLYAALMKEKA